MKKKRILVVEDSVPVKSILEKFLGEHGYAVATASNGEEAMSLILEEPFGVILTDLEMPVMSGGELIDRIKDRGLNPEVIVITSHDTPDLIVEIMKKNVADYIIKPVRKSNLLMKVERAFTMSELKQHKALSEKEKIIRLEHQVEWYKFLEGNDTARKNRSDFFSNLQRSLYQGAGFGTLITLANMIISSSRYLDGGYWIPESLYDQIVGNQEVIYNAVNLFAEIDQLTSGPLELESLDVRSLYFLVHDIVIKMNALTAIKNQKIIISDSKPYFRESRLAIHRQFFKKLMHELFVNAMKYSARETCISMLMDMKDDNLEISIMNSPENNSGDIRGIPQEYENIVFEPFFRISKIIQEEYKTLDFGLGLTLAERIVKNHGGKISINNVIDHSDYSRNPCVKINCAVTIPLAG
jgi:YesN/AraC family two-component response regulator